MRIVKLLFILIIMMLGAVFAVHNSDPVLFNYYFDSRELPLSLIITVALGVGVVIGILSAIGLVVALKRENAALKRRSKLVSEEVNNLRTIPLKDK
ncbi:MAG: LapA family protein [Pseudomonadota bacterium]